MPASRVLWVSFGLLVCGCSSGDNSTAETLAPAQVNINESKDTKPATPVVADRTLTPFSQSVRLEPPDEELRPPDETAGGKVTAKIFEQIAGRDGAPGLWDQVKFVAADGKPVKYHAVVKTDAGDMKFELLHEAAPQHVRSFISLARAGYFDGLPFHASLRRGAGVSFYGYLESGCPKGTGELGYGSIGYWLKPEVSDRVHHEEGTVGAWHPGEIERAACRFYITLHRHRAFDGNYTIFGKVVHGLEVAHTINKRPMQDEEYKGPPQEPYRIRQVLIQQAP